MTEYSLDVSENKTRDDIRYAAAKMYCDGIPEKDFSYYVPENMIARPIIDGEYHNAYAKGRVTASDYWPRKLVVVEKKEVNLICFSESTYSVQTNAHLRVSGVIIPIKVMVVFGFSMEGFRAIEDLVSGNASGQKDEGASHVLYITEEDLLALITQDFVEAGARFTTLAQMYDSLAAAKADIEKRIRNIDVITGRGLQVVTVDVLPDLAAVNEIRDKELRESILDQIRE